MGVSTELSALAVKVHSSVLVMRSHIRAFVRFHHVRSKMERCCDEYMRVWAEDLGVEMDTDIEEMAANALAEAKAAMGQGEDGPELVEDGIILTIDELEAMRSTLETLVTRCHGDDRPDCPILNDLAGSKGGSV